MTLRGQLKALTLSIIEESQGFMFQYSEVQKFSQPQSMSYQD